MKRWLVGILLLSVLAIGGVFYWQFVNSPTDIPPLFPQVAWEEFVESENDKSLGEQGLFSQGEIFGSIRMSGQEWTASKSNLDRDLMDKLLLNFRYYYDKELTKLGWTTSYEDVAYNLEPSAADGPGGSTWGYVNVKGGKLREILLAQFTTIERFGGIATCPCKVTFRIFVSEAVPLEELIKRVEE